MKNNFVHLKLYSLYSLSEGAIRFEEIVSLCKKHSMPAIGITDKNNMFGSLEFAMAMSSNSIQPIMGISIQIVPFEEKNDNRQKHDWLNLYAQNEKGYKNLLKLTSISYLESGSNSEPYITLEHLKKYNEGIIALSGSVHGSIGRNLLNNNYSKANEETKIYKELFDNRFYLEICRHGLTDEIKTEKNFLKLALENDIPIVATNNVYFSDRSFVKAHDSLLCIANGTYILDESREKSCPEFYFKSPKEMSIIFSDLPEALENTINIARRCSYFPDKNSPILPSFTENKEKSEAEYLSDFARNGLKIKLSEKYKRDIIEDKSKQQEIEKEYNERLDFELDVIIKMQFPGYFLIVSDFIKWAKQNDIPVGPGRGSGAGSLVAWCLDITDVDPIKFSLLFERFLNPERVSMPDFDIDFCQERRDEVIKYVVNKYGQDKVAHIITFGKLQARAVLRDVGRVMQIPYGQVDRISKLIPHNPVNPYTLQRALDVEPLLSKARKEDEVVAQMIDIGLKLEGLNRHASTHAAGIVIGDRPLVDIVPLYKDEKSDMMVVQYSMKYAEAIGLVKFDFLGLKTLTVIAKTKELINKDDPNFSIESINYNDAKTFEMLGNGYGIGVFQFEGKGMRESLKKLKPDSLDDIIALGALYRPGPMDNIPTYIARKHGHEEIDYIHPMLKDILKDTYGVIIYQEQVMQIAQVLSGYSLASADLLRRAMGKKIKSEMDAQRQFFVQGAIKNGVNKDQASFIFDLVDKFAGYGFNKSHAVSYGIISYQTAYLKANYTAEFFVASMNMEIDDTDKIFLFCQDAISFGIKILPPSVNYSDAYFKIEIHNGEKAIRYGLGALKNVGLNSMESMVNLREKDLKKFKNLTEFIKLIDDKSLNKRQIEYLIKSGSLDELHDNRNELFHNIDNIHLYKQQINQNKSSNQRSLFGSTIAENEIRLQVAEEWNNEAKLNFQREAIGFYLNSHPLEQYSFVLEKFNYSNSEKLKDLDSDRFIEIPGIITDVKAKFSAKGKFAFLQLSDNYGSFEVSIFNENMLTEKSELIKENSLVLVGAEAKIDENGLRLITKNIIDLKQEFSSIKAKMLINVKNDNIIERIAKLLSESSEGNMEVEIITHSVKGEKLRILIPNKYIFDINLIDNMKKIAGDDGVEIKL